MNRELVIAHLLRLIDDLERNAGGTSRDLLRAATCIEHVVMSDLLPQEEEEAILADPRMAARVARLPGDLLASRKFHREEHGRRGPARRARSDLGPGRM